LRWAPGRLCWVYSPGCCTDAGRFQSHRCDGLPGASVLVLELAGTTPRFNRTVAMGSREPRVLTGKPELPYDVAFQSHRCDGLPGADGQEPCVHSCQRRFNRTVAMGSREPTMPQGNVEPFFYENGFNRTVAMGSREPAQLYLS